MLVIENFDQGSKEWHRLREGKVTASRINSLLTTTFKTSTSYKGYAAELVSEIMLYDHEKFHDDGEVFYNPDFVSSDMERGIELEDEARIFYQEKTLNLVRQISFFDCGDFGGSPDGLVEDDGLIEIKCPKNKVHIQYVIDDEVPKCYLNQCQGLLLASGRKWVDFVSYNKNFENKEFIKRIYRDEDHISLIKESVNKVISYRNNILKDVFNYDKEILLNYPRENKEDLK